MKNAETKIANRKPRVKETKHRPTWVDKTGMVFGRLTVIKFHGIDKYKHSEWLCQCWCGKVCVVKGCGIGRSSNSCGCLKSDWTASKNFQHGQCERKNTTSEYRIWSGMKKRCSNPKSKSFHNYGGRGIKVCQRWLDSFESFFKDVGPRPAGKSLDRWPLKNGDYEPSNVRWATPIQQGNNRRDNHILVFNGKSQSVSEWGRESKVSIVAFKQRIKKGWSIEHALNMPKISPGRRLKCLLRNTI